MDAKLTIADKLGRGLTNGIYFVTRKWKTIMLGYIFVISIGSALLYFHDEQQPSLQTRSWGGFDERPLTEKCYRQERTAMILSLLFGVIGADQFYAHHWPLAVFKLVTLGGAGVWAFVDMILWIVGGVYGTPGCPGGSSKGWQY
ncbi:TM2 domain-containing protein [Fusarium pseudoanthophilum]|uniref:TM2 domain-containing protein n=1 Tax=Fusarium pseudoanthophilum TaxID=48495 RepID=A0A8H5PH69_9HYPO|nr:TM2 domain-containing protein [Fusarium pseudoanthophilum]